MNAEARKASFSKWYANNKEKLAKARSDKYHSDPEYRQKALESAARYREKASRDTEAVEPQHFRDIDGVRREVFRIGAVAALIGRDEQTIRLWESRGVIPKPSAPGIHRYYTEHQVSLLKGLCAELGSNRYDAPSVQEGLDRQRSIIFSNWKG